jgi:hypothetical protein
MYDRVWTKPISVDLPEIGKVVISTTREAADCLIDHWPVDYSKAYDEALRICLEVYEGNEMPEAAREAFIVAAGVVAVSVTFMEPRGGDNRRHIPPRMNPPLPPPPPMSVMTSSGAVSSA